MKHNGTKTFGNNGGRHDRRIEKTELKNELELKNYLLDILKTDVSEDYAEFITDNTLIIPNAMLTLEKA